MTLPYNGFTKLIDKLIFEELSGAANSCLPLMREVGSRQAARRERKPKDTVFVG